MGEARDSDQVLQITGIERGGVVGWGTGQYYDRVKVSSPLYSY